MCDYVWTTLVPDITQHINTILTFATNSQEADLDVSFNPELGDGVLLEDVEEVGEAGVLIHLRG